MFLSTQPYYQFTQLPAFSFTSPLLQDSASYQLPVSSYHGPAVGEAHYQGLHNEPHSGKGKRAFVSRTNWPLSMDRHATLPVLWPKISGALHIFTSSCPQNGSESYFLSATSNLGEPLHIFMLPVPRKTNKQLRTWALMLNLLENVAFVLTSQIFYSLCISCARRCDKGYWVCLHTGSIDWSVHVRGDVQTWNRAN